MKTETVPLGSHVRVIGGFAFPSESYSDDGVPVIRISDIKDGLVSAKYAAKIPEELAGKGWNYQVGPGDILIAMSGATTGKIGVVADDFDGPFLQNQRVGNFRVVDSTKVDKVYLRHYLTSPSYQKQLRNLMAGAAQPNISSKQLESIELPLPPLPEQKRIAAILDKADSIRRKRQEAVRLTEELLRSVFLDMFGDPVTNPKGWLKSKLSEVVTGKYGIKAGPFGSSLKKEDYTTAGYRIYGQEQVIAGRFDIGDYYIGERKFQQLKGCKVTEGDLLVSLVGSFGKVLVVPSGIEPGIINPRLLKITPNRDLVTPTFLAAVIGNPSIQTAFGQMAHGGTMGILNVGLLKQLDVILPPLKLQSEFARRLDAHNKLEKSLQLSLISTDTLFVSLLQRAFKGEV